MVVFKAQGAFMSHLFGYEARQVYSVALHPTKLSRERLEKQPVTSVSQEYVKKITGGGTQRVWIEDVSPQKEWRWVDNTPVTRET